MRKSCRTEREVPVPACQQDIEEKFPLEVSVMFVNVIYLAISGMENSVGRESFLNVIFQSFKYYWLTRTTR